MACSVTHQATLKPLGAGPSWNPLVCNGTHLSPNWLLAGKLLVLFLFVHAGPVWSPLPFLPFMPVLDGLGVAAVGVMWGLRGAFFFFALALLFNRLPRTACFMLGLIVLFSILMSRTSFSNNRMLAGCLLLLIGLQEPGRPPWLIRAQVVLVYFGAGLNKLLDPDWQSGQFFEFWAHEVLQHALYAEAAALFPPLLLSRGMCWLVIAVELGLAVGFALPRLYRYVIPVGLCFHGGMLVFTGGTLSWLFFYLMSAAYLAVVRWPEGELTVYHEGPRGRRLRRILTHLDLEGRYRWQPGTFDPGRASPALPVQVVRGGKVFAGFAALLWLLILNPLSYIAMAGLLLGKPSLWLLRKTLSLL